MELTASQPVQLADGGIRAYEVEGPAIITDLPAGVAAYAFVTEDGDLVSENVDQGTKLERGQTLVLSAPVADTVEGTLTVQLTGSPTDGSPAGGASSGGVDDEGRT